MIEKRRNELNSGNFGQEPPIGTTLDGGDFRGRKTSLDAPLMLAEGIRIPVRRIANPSYTSPPMVDYFLRPGSDLGNAGDALDHRGRLGRVIGRRRGGGSIASSNTGSGAMASM